jgi:hypothetical protein
VIDLKTLMANVGAPTEKANDTIAQALRELESQRSGIGAHFPFLPVFSGSETG